MFQANLFASLLLILSALVGVTTARPNNLNRRAPSPTVPVEGTEKWSNAQLLAAGLQPRKPQNLYTPSRVIARHGKKHYPSGVPQKKCQIFVDKVGSLGWNKFVSEDHTNNKKYYGVDVPEHKRMEVRFTPSSGPINLEIRSDSTYPYLGFAGETLGNNNAFYMTDTNGTPAGSTPQSVGNSLAPGIPKSESALWFYDSNTGRFTAKWVQPNGDIITPKFWYFNNNGGLAIVKKDQNSGWEVKLYCVPEWD